MNIHDDFIGNRVKVRTPDVRESMFRHGIPYPWRNRGTKPVLGPLMSHDMALEREMQEATRENQRRWALQSHESMRLWTMQEHCAHSDPSEDDNFDGDTIEFFDTRVSRHEKWSLKDHKVIITDDYAHAFSTAARDQSTVYQSWSKAQEVFDDTHDGRLCMNDPQGSVCTTCAHIHDEGDDDFGYEPSGCRIGDDARDAYDDFWTANGHADWRPKPDELTTIAWLGRIAGHTVSA